MLIMFPIIRVGFAMLRKSAAGWSCHAPFGQLGLCNDNITQSLWNYWPLKTLAGSSSCWQNRVLNTMSHHFSLMRQLQLRIAVLARVWFPFLFLEFLDVLSSFLIFRVCLLLKACFVPVSAFASWLKHVETSFGFFGHCPVFKFFFHPPLFTICFLNNIQRAVVRTISVE